MDTIWVPIAYTLAVLGVTALAIDALRTAWREKRDEVRVNPAYDDMEASR